MWEQIKANRRRSAVLIAALGGVMAVMGFTLGEAFGGRGWGLGGLLVAAVIFGIQLLVYYAAAEQVLLSGMGATEIGHDEMPRLYNIVEEMKLASGFPVMPKVYLIDNPTPNAFAVGRTPETSAIAVTSGLLYRLNRDELQGVVAHEMGHLSNRDTRFMTLAGVMLGTIIILSEIVWRTAAFGGRVGDRDRSRGGDGGGGQGQMIMMIVALLVAALGPLLAQVLYFACSRKREYLADACAAQFTRYPQGLASALERIAGSSQPMVVSKAVAPIVHRQSPAQGCRGRTRERVRHPPAHRQTRVGASRDGGRSLAGRL